MKGAGTEAERAGTKAKRSVAGWIGLKRGIDKTSGSATRFTGNIKGMRPQMMNMNNTVSDATRTWATLKFIMATIGVAKVAKSFLDMNSSMEKYLITLKALIGDQIKANTLFQNMVKYASAVPYTFQEIMGIATSLSGVIGTNIKDIEYWVRLIGDLSGVTAALEVSFQQTAIQVIRMISAGAAAADLFREKGITAMLGFEAGVKYTAEKTREMLVAAFEDPESKFRGLAKKLSTTYTGILSMISDAWALLMYDIGQTGAFESIKGWLDEINVSLRAWTATNKELIKVKVPEWLGKIETHARNILGFIKNNPSIMKYGIVGALIWGKKGLVLGTALGKVVDMLKAAEKAATPEAHTRGKIEKLEKERSGYLAAIIRPGPEWAREITRGKLQAVEALIANYRRTEMNTEDLRIQKLKERFRIEYAILKIREKLAAQEPPHVLTPPPIKEVAPSVFFALEQKLELKRITRERKLREVETKYELQQGLKRVAEAPLTFGSMDLFFDDFSAKIDQMKAEIEGVADTSLPRWSTAIEAVSATLESSLGGALADLAFGFRTLEEVALSVLQEIATAMLQVAAIEPFVGFLKGLKFGGGGTTTSPSTTLTAPNYNFNVPPLKMAGGGSLSPGWKLIGEQGPELMRIGSGAKGQVYSNVDSKRMMGGGDQFTYIKIDAVDAKSISDLIEGNSGAILSVVSKDLKAGAGLRDVIKEAMR